MNTVNMVDVKTRISDIVAKVMEVEKNDAFMGRLNDFTKLGMSSIDFIKVVVMIEDEYDFEFDDDDLDLKKFQNFDELCEYVEKIAEKD